MRKFIGFWFKGYSQYKKWNIRIDIDEGGIAMLDRVFEQVMEKGKERSRAEIGPIRPCDGAVLNRGFLEEFNIFERLSHFSMELRFKVKHFDCSIVESNEQCVIKEMPDFCHKVKLHEPSYGIFIVGFEYLALYQFFL
jgi:hypothetical protein